MHIFVSLLRFLGWSVLLAVASILLIGSGFFLALAPSLPDVEQLRDIQLQTPMRIYTRDEKLIAEFGEQRRTPVSIEQVPQQLINAFLAAEDARFYEHPGVDIKGLTRAAVELVTTGSIQSGGSTITMQVAKNYFLSQERTFSRKFNEILLAFKIEQEMTKNEILALYFNKIYLGNRAYGIEAAANVYYGVSLKDLNLAQMAMIAGLPKAPSRYNPLASPERAVIRRNWILDRMLELDMVTPSEHDEATQAPASARYFTTQLETDAPYVAEMARIEALDRLGAEAYTKGYRLYLTIDATLQDAADLAMKQGLIRYSKRHGYRGATAYYNTPYPKSKEDIVARLAKTPSNRVISPAWIISVDDMNKVATALLSSGSEVSIPFDSMVWANRFQSPNAQGSRPQKVSDVLAQGDIVYVEAQDTTTAFMSQKPVVQGALVSLDVKSGGILALTGGFDFYMSKFNRAAQAKRQPGSNFKPFVYLAGLEKGLTAASIFNDAPVVFEDASLESAWRPENSSGEFYGPTRLREALYMSRNLVSIRLLQRLGIHETITFLDQAGFPKSELPPNLSLALGTGTFTPLEIARGYATLANQGTRVYPYLVQRITDHEGKPLYLYSAKARKLVEASQCEDCSPDTKDQATASLSFNTNLEGGDDEGARFQAELDKIEIHNDTIADPRNVFILTDMLKDVIRRGTATDARKLGRSDIAGKTGTTNDQVDAWFSGYSPDIATSVWVGYDQPETLGHREYGSRAALPIWMDYMTVALKNHPDLPAIRPEGIASVKIDPETGERAAPDNPNAIFELFLEENVPEASDEIYYPEDHSGGTLLSPDTIF